MVKRPGGDYQTLDEIIKKSEDLVRENEILQSKYKDVSNDKRSLEADIANLKFERVELEKKMKEINVCTTIS